MNKRVFLVGICIFLLITNTATVAFYNYKLSNLHRQSSFTVLSDESASLKKCLDDARIDNKVDNGKTLIRDIDRGRAIDSCA